MDLLDRIISSSLDAHKDQLQLIGITCLFIASKVEVRIQYFDPIHIQKIYTSIYLIAND